jgi:hypothetical protein
MSTVAAASRPASLPLRLPRGHLACGFDGAFLLVREVTVEFSGDDEIVTRRLSVRRWSGADPLAPAQQGDGGAVADASPDAADAAPVPRASAKQPGEVLSVQLPRDGVRGSAAFLTAGYLHVLMDDALVKVWDVSQAKCIGKLRAPSPIVALHVDVLPSAMDAPSPAAPPSGGSGAAGDDAERAAAVYVEDVSSASGRAATAARVGADRDRGVVLVASATPGGDDGGTSGAVTVATAAAVDGVARSHSRSRSRSGSVSLPVTVVAVSDVRLVVLTQSALALVWHGVTLVRSVDLRRGAMALPRLRHDFGLPYFVRCVGDNDVVIVDDAAVYCTCV